MDKLLQKAIDDMNSIDQYHRCFLCDYFDNCDRIKYITCNDFSWNGIKPTKKEREDK